MVQPGDGDNGNGAGDAGRTSRWGRGDGSLVAGRANRAGTTLVINRPSDVWPWLARRKENRSKGTVLLVVASFLVLVLAAGQGYVSWFAQFGFINAAKHAVLASGIEALGLDTGAVIFALLALALVRLQRRAIVPRILNVSCACGSLAMNVLAADLASPRSIAIYALPSALYATASDQLIAVVRRHALPAKVDEDEQRSAWAMAWRALVRVVRGLALTVAWVLRVPLYLLRLLIAPTDTFGGLRQLVMALTPLPEAERPATESRTARRAQRRRRRSQGPAPAPHGRPGREADQEVSPAEGLRRPPRLRRPRTWSRPPPGRSPPRPSLARAPPAPTSTNCSTRPRPRSWTRSGANSRKPVPQHDAQRSHSSSPCS